MTLEQIELRLREVPLNHRHRNVESLRQYLVLHKRDFVASGDQEDAKRVWCLEQVLRVQEQYIKAFDELRVGHFYPAWCQLERVEIGDNHLRRHLRDSPSTFWLDFILEKTRQWQNLFPYRMFFSPAYVAMEKSCDVCGEKVRLRGGCSHRQGEIYDGEMCCYHVDSVSIQEVSLTPFPHQKYSVAFPGGSKDNDTYDYAAVQATIDVLDTPFRDWEIQNTRRRVPIAKFDPLDADQTCPCESGRHFGACCSGQQSIEVPWVHIAVDSPETQRTSSLLHHTFRTPTRFADHKRLISTVIFDAKIS